VPIVNLIVAQAAAAWIAAPNLVSLLYANGPAYNYVVAAAAGVIIVIGAFIGARITKAVPGPTLTSAFTAVAFAIIAAFAADKFLGPSALTSEFAFHATSFSPVAAAIAGYLLTSDYSA
jgi:uncharacterized membrane protein YfcA